MVLVISLKLRLPGHSSGEVFAADGAGLRSGGGLMGGSARGLIRDGAGSNGAVGISCFYKTSEAVKRWLAFTVLETIRCDKWGYF